MPNWLSWMIPEGWSSRDVAIAATLFTISSALLSLVLVAFAVIQIPVDYFTNPNPKKMWIGRHPIIRWSLIFLKNIAGVFLILLGIVLSFPGVPGQGVLTILIGLLLVDLPRKQRFEKWLVSRRGVLIAANRLRARFGHLPLQLTVPFSEPLAEKTATPSDQLPVGVPDSQNPIPSEGK